MTLSTIKLGMHIPIYSVPNIGISSPCQTLVFIVSYEESGTSYYYNLTNFNLYGLGL